jgi:hypothetical protein
VSYTEDLRAELDALRAERDALIAERERTAPVVAAARAYVDATMVYAAALEATREAFAAWERSSTPNAARAVGTAMDNERAALAALVVSARALHTDGGAK